MDDKYKSFFPKCHEYSLWLQPNFPPLQNSHYFYFSFILGHFAI